MVNYITDPEFEICPEGYPILPPDWTRPGVFDDLSMEEIEVCMIRIPIISM